MGLEHHRSATPNELMGLGTDHQWMLTSQKQRVPYNGNLLKGNSTTWEGVLPKTLNQNLVMPLSN